MSTMNRYADAVDSQVDDYNFGTLMRNDPKAEYTETTTIFGEILIENKVIVRDNYRV